jgi:Flp pilus assembly protein TadG
MLLRRKPQRRGAVLVESAIVYPILFLLMLGIVMVSMAVFRYQQVAHLAREGSRWASVHGAKYASETGNPVATPSDVYENAIKPLAAGMQMGNVTYEVAWNKYNSTYPTAEYDRYHTKTVTDPATGISTVVYEANTVSVTVTYSWNTGFFGTIPVSSTSTVVMSY